MRLERVQERRDARDEGVVDLPLVLELDDLLPAVFALLVNLGLLGADEGSLVDIGVDLDVRIIRELEGVLELMRLGLECLLAWSGLQAGRRMGWYLLAYPLAIVDRHLG